MIKNGSSTRTNQTKYLLSLWAVILGVSAAEVIVTCSTVAMQRSREGHALLGNGR
jgi:hypothetical protein